MRWIRAAVREIHRRDLWKVLALYAGASWGALEVVGLFVERGILPEGAFLGTLIVLLVFLPVFLATAFVQRGLPAWLDPLPEGEALAEKEGSKEAELRGFLTWKRALVAGVFALGMVGVGAGGYMTMRIMGIGSPGTLLAQGLIEDGEPILLADFQSNAPALPGQVVTEALRINLAQSPTIRPLSNSEVRDVLTRMQADPQDPLDEARAREVAEREGIKAFVAGAVTSVGGRYLITARLMETPGDRELVSFQETARDSTKLLDAIDRLGKSIRDKAGESLRSIQANVPLLDVTTSSLEALRYYSQAEDADRRGDMDRAIYLFREAIRLDSAFAMAHRKIGVQLYNSRSNPSEQTRAYTRAFELRDKLPPIERFLADASYYRSVVGDFNAAANAYQSVLDMDPNHGTALNNLGLLYLRLGDPRSAERVLRQDMADDPSNTNYVNLVRVLVEQGRTGELDEVFREWEARFPESPHPLRDRALLAFKEGRYAAADSMASLMLSRFPQHQVAIFYGPALLWASAGVEGRWSESEALARRFIQQNAAAGIPEWVLTGELIRIEGIIRSTSDTAWAKTEFSRARQENPLSSMAPLNRPYLRLARTAIAVGQTATADSVLQEFEAAIPTGVRGELQHEDPREVRALMAVATGNLDAGVEELQRLRTDCETLCRVRALFSLGEAHQASGNLDAALQAYQDYLSHPFLDGLQADAYRRPQAVLRIAQLYEELGNPVEAASWYRRFADLWANADPLLMPKVEKALRRAQSLELGS